MPNFHLTNIIGEVGSITASQANATQWHTVTLANAYTSAVIIVSPLSFTACDPATVRVRNVGATSFEYQIGEWDYLDGVNTAQETFFYMVIEAGEYDLGGGVKLQACQVSINQNWSSITYPSAFNDDPFVFAQIVTTNEATAATTRLQVDIKVEEEQSNDSEMSHDYEAVGFMVFDEVGNLNGITIALSDSGTSSLVSFPNNTGFINTQTALDYFNATVFPNPTSNFINLSYRLDTKALVEIQIFDVNGKKYYTERLTQDAGSREVSISTENLPKGILYVNLLVGDNVFARKS